MAHVIYAMRYSKFKPLRFADYSKSKLMSQSTPSPYRHDRDLLEKDLDLSPSPGEARSRSRRRGRSRSKSQSSSRDLSWKRRERPSRRRDEIPPQQRSYRSVTVPIKINDRRGEVVGCLSANDGKLLDELRKKYFGVVKVDLNCAEPELIFSGRAYNVKSAILKIFAWMKHRFGIWYDDYEHVRTVALNIAREPRMSSKSGPPMFDADIERRDEDEEVDKSAKESGGSNDAQKYKELYRNLSKNSKFQADEIKKLNRSNFDLKAQLDRTEVTEKTNTEADFELQKNKLKGEYKAEIDLKIKQLKTEYDQTIINIKVEKFELEKENKLLEEQIKVNQVEKENLMKEFDLEKKMKEKIQQELQSMKTNFSLENEMENRILEFEAKNPKSSFESENNDNNNHDQNKNLKQENDNPLDIKALELASASGFLASGSVKVKSGPQKEEVSFLKNRLVHEKVEFNKLLKKYNQKRELVNMREKEIEGNKNVIYARDQEIKNLKETVNDLKKQLLSEDDGIEVLN